MEKHEILKKVSQVFAEVLEENELELTNDTTAKDVDGWDSLTHVELIYSLEQEFGITFTSMEMQSWNNVGEMLGTIYTKLNRSK
jgi:acyl carrier protein